MFDFSFVVEVTFRFLDWYLTILVNHLTKM
jgi:hypothetical protein